MPVYFILSKSDFGSEAKKVIAGAITDVHCAVTGAPSRYVTVLFMTGYRLLNEKKTMLLGNIRIDGNRTRELVDQLRHRLVGAVAEKLGEPDSAVGLSFLGVYSNWVWEGGEVIPVPGKELV